MTNKKINKTKAIKQKPYLTIEEQIILLKSKGFKVRYKNYLICYLKMFGYQNLVNGYNDLLFINQQRSIDKYKKNVSENELIKIFNFDRSISSIILNDILNVERIFVNQLSDILCRALVNKYGDKNCCLLNLSDKNIREIFLNWFKNNQNNKKDIKKEILLFYWHKSKNHELVKKYRDNFKSIPLWNLSKFWTFGNFQYILCDCLNDFYVNIFIKNIDLDFIKCKADLKKYLKIFKEIRNKCCHNDVLYNFSCDKEKLYDIVDKIDKINIKLPVKLKYKIDNEFNSYFKNFDKELLDLLKKVMNKKP